MSFHHVVFCFLLLISLAACFQKHYTYFNDSSDWYTAKMMCMYVSTDGTSDLVHADDVTEAMFVLPTNESLAWINQIAEFSVFAQYKGCFNTKVGSSFKITRRTDTGQETNVRTCMEICTKLGIFTFSLKKDTCDCMTANLATFQMESLSSCNVTCSGDVRDICGGSNALSVYAANDIVADGLTTNSEELQCYYVMKMRDMLDTQTGSCLDIKTGYICSICYKDSSNCTSQVVDESTTWYGARDACSRRHGVLSDDRSAVLDAAQANGLFWTGLRRWIVRRAPSDQYDGHLCVACSNQNGDVSCVNRNCEDNNGYVCSEMRMPTMLPLVDSTSTSESNESTTHTGIESLNSTYETVTESLKSSTDKTPANETTEQTSSMKQKTEKTKIETATQALVTSSFTVHTSELLTEGSISKESLDDNRRRIQERQARVGRIFMVLGIIVGILFVLSVTALVVLNVRRKRRSRSENLHGAHLNGKGAIPVMFRAPERQRSFTNPGYYEPNMASFDDVNTNGIIPTNSRKVQNRGLENTRTSDDCSTFTKTKNNNLKTENEKPSNIPREEQETVQADDEKVEEENIVHIPLTVIQDPKEPEQNENVETPANERTDITGKATDDVMESANDVTMTSHIPLKERNTDEYAPSLENTDLVIESEDQPKDIIDVDSQDLKTDHNIPGVKTEDLALESSKAADDPNDRVKEESTPAIENDDSVVDVNIPSPKPDNNVEDDNTDDDVQLL